MALYNFSFAEEFKTLDYIIEKAGRSMFEKPMKEKFSSLEGKNISDERWLLLDIKKYCNGNFSRWTGSQNLKYIETGEKRYYGVPFKIISEEEQLQTCIITKSEIIDGVYDVKIPVNRKVEAIYFLHANYYASPEEIGERKFTIEYSDGTSEGLSLIGEENMFDWWPQKRTENENLKYVLVRTSESFKPPYRNLYIIQWKNPFNEKVISNVGFHSDGKGMRATIIIGITLLLNE